MTGSVRILRQALEKAISHFGRFEQICLLQVTSPLRRPSDIDRAVELLSESDVESVVSVSPFVTPPQWAVKQGEDGYLEEYFDFGTMWGDEYVRTQDVPELTHPNGAVFVATTQAWREYESFYTPQTIGYEMPPEYSFDIDESWELDLVRTLMKQRSCETDYW